MSNAVLKLNANHRNTLLAGFKYIDRLLAEAVTGLMAADNGAIFSPAVADATPVQRKVVGDLADRLRRALRAALDECGIPVRPPTLSALWNLRTVLISIDIAVEELGADHLRGYGAIDNETAGGVAALQAQVRTRLVELQAYLESGFGGDLSARLARLEETSNEVRLLRELERIITARGLVEFRQPLAQLLERLEKNEWTVAFVGRVSSGKSSLLNYLLATDVLPSGVTPVTAVPIRIVPGVEPVATVSFATGKPERVPAAQLAEFASEERNPGNARHVTDILLALPASRLASGICFVDTPGLGSLATVGAAQTLAFLPRCDLGVFLLDAAATLAETDIEVVRTLLESGAEAVVVLSKADLLGAADREKMLTYVRRQFAQALGREIAVVPVSVAAGHTALAETWFAAVLEPRQARHRELAAATLRRKVGALREAVMQALQRRKEVPAAGTPSALEAVDFGTVRALIEGNRRRLYDLAFQSTPRAEVVLEGAATQLAEKPVETAPVLLTEALAAGLAASGAELGDAFTQLLRETREAAERALRAAAVSLEATPLPEPFSRPLFDPASVLVAGKFSSSWRHWPSIAARRAALRRHLQGQFGAVLDEAMRAYAHALVGWGQHYLDELAALFNAQAGFIEAGAARPARGLWSPETERDFVLLKTWNAEPAAV
ncbi:MAG: dynamin family protein [Lacunisphaera sp.]